MLDNPDIDYVTIATPEHTHSKITIDAFDAGKAVYCEKPMTHTIPQAQAVMKKQKETARPLQVGVQAMSDDSYASAAKAIAEGVIGKVVQAQIEYVRRYDKQGPWREPDMSDTEPQPGDLDWNAWLGDAPQSALEPAPLSRMALLLGLFRRHRHRPVHPPHHADHAGLQPALSPPGGRHGRHLAMARWPRLARQLRNDLRISARHDGLRAGDEKQSRAGRSFDSRLSRHAVVHPDGWVAKDKDGKVLGLAREERRRRHPLHHTNLHNHLRSGEPLKCPVELGMAGVVAVNMANESWRTSKMMAWDPKNEKMVPADTLDSEAPAGRTIRRA